MAAKVLLETGVLYLVALCMILKAATAVIRCAGTNLVNPWMTGNKHLRAGSGRSWANLRSKNDPPSARERIMSGRGSAGWDSDWTYLVLDAMIFQRFVAS